jgi:hypothetical protein
LRRPLLFESEEKGPLFLLCVEDIDRGIAMRTFRLFFMFLTLLPISAFAIAGDHGGRSVNSTGNTTGNDLYRPFLINSVFNYFGNNGDGSFNKFSTTNEGFEFTKGTGKTCIFEDGIVWGGYHKGRATPKVGGSTYIHGLSAGPILQYGTASTNPVKDDPTNPSNRIYRVRPDINPGTAFADVQSKIVSGELPYISRYESYTDQDIYNQYIKDWNEWPAAQGAPFSYGKDSNSVQRLSGPYDPRYDIPGRPAADQTLWYAANDCDSARVATMMFSSVIGLEMHRTIWGYNRAGVFGQTIFESTVIINKSGARVDSMYIMQFADPDLGDGGDDYVGCDTSRNLGYVYNGRPSDLVFGTSIPSAGFVILQGPIVPGAPGDTAAFLMGKRLGYRNLRMSAFVFFSQGFAGYADPVYGPGMDLQWYRVMQGKTAEGASFIDPVTHSPTKFCMSGNPLIGSGWVDGMAGLTPQDRRFTMTTGPVTMAAGDTQEIVVALTAGLGADYLSSIAVLRSGIDRLISFYNTLTGVGPLMSIATSGNQLPETSGLMQNYPNPFNPSTRIGYTLARRSAVSLTVFNVLGEEVASLVNGVEEAGPHEVKFDGTRLSSGAYFYTLRADGFVQTKRLLLIR